MQHANQEVSFYITLPSNHRSYSNFTSGPDNIFFLSGPRFNSESQVIILVVISLVSFHLDQLPAESPQRPLQGKRDEGEKEA